MLLPVGFWWSRLFNNCSTRIYRFESGKLRTWFFKTFYRNTFLWWYRLVQYYRPKVHSNRFKVVLAQKSTTALRIGMVPVFGTFEHLRESGLKFDWDLCPALVLTVAFMAEQSWKRETFYGWAQGYAVVRILMPWEFCTAIRSWPSSRFTVNTSDRVSLWSIVPWMQQWFHMVVGRSFHKSRIQSRKAKRHTLHHLRQHQTRSTMVNVEIVETLAKKRAVLCAKMLREIAIAFLTSAMTTTTGTWWNSNVSKHAWNVLQEEEEGMEEELT